LKRRKVPLRMCISCKEMKPKKELLRIVKNSEGKINIDLNGKLPGRGAYICHNPQCLEKAIKHKLFERIFQQKVDKEIYVRLTDILTENDEDI